MKRRAFNEKTNFFGLSFLLFSLDCRSTNLLRLFSGNLPAMFEKFGRFEFVSSFDALFSLTFAHTAKLKE